METNATAAKARKGDEGSVEEQAAAAVRKAVTNKLLGAAGWGLLDRPEVLEALILCRHLTVGRDEDAKRAHRALVQELDRELHDLGIVDEWYSAVLNALAGFLTGPGGYQWKNQDWEPDPIVVELEARRRAGGGAPSPDAG